VVNGLVAAVPSILARPRMNFLGHLLVSGKDPLVITGNFMADAVKGRDLSHYAEQLQKGIRMHRAIDTFTDNHPLTLVGRERLRAHCGKYAGVALDLFYDHVFADQWHRLSDEPLQRYAARMYALLLDHIALMPERTQRMLRYMAQGDWLSSYARVEGIGTALRGLAGRVPGGAALIGAEHVLTEHLDAYREEGLEFLGHLRQHLHAHG
jgi:acyl carrier protein phosphodiesterase